MNQYIALTSNDSATPALSIPACRWKYSSTLRPIAFVPLPKCLRTSHCAAS